MFGRRDLGGGWVSRVAIWFALGVVSLGCACSLDPIDVHAGEDAGTGGVGFGFAAGSGGDRALGAGRDGGMPAHAVPDAAAGSGGAGIGEVKTVDGTGGARRGSGGGGGGGSRGGGGGGGGPPASVAGGMPPVKGGFAGGAAATGAAGVGGRAGAGGGFAAPGAGELKITELLIDPAGTDTGREWVEIANGSAHPVDLSDLHVADLLNDAAVDWGAVLPVLAVGQRALLIQSVDPTKNGGILIVGGLLGGGFGTRVSLNNDADALAVCVGPCSSGAVIDRFAWSAPPGPGYEGHALSLDDQGRICPAAAPFGDADSFGSPGVANPPCP